MDLFARGFDCHPEDEAGACHIGPGIANGFSPWIETIGDL
jgi:hypothetical protein